jgi:prepilin signal peptidase PulO-like enzyme (type II secretory pathway)
LNAFIALPLPLRLAILAVLGIIAGALINLGIYALAWRPRPISPWQRPHPKAPRRIWSDFLPILGWFGLARESNLHGRGFWIRPLFVELLCGIGLPLLYYWVTELSALAPPVPLLGFVLATPVKLHHEFMSYTVLLSLMLVATFIDFDEKTIPDEITIPGALLGLILAAIWPDAHLPVEHLLAPPLPIRGYGPLLLTSTSEWPAWLNSLGGLAIGISIFIAWCLAMIPALATLRRGWWRGVRLYFASIARESAWWKMLILASLGSAAIVLVWRAGGAPWQALLTSLVGLGFGGGMIWSVRIVGRLALHKEAMGFGDVTLMAMIGAFLGWQPCLMIFFLSPFAALVIAVAQWALTGRRDIPYGPYLCAAALVVILWWPWFWTNFGAAFAAGWLVPSVLAVCLVLLMALLTVWRLIESAFVR